MLSTPDLALLLVKKVFLFMAIGAVLARLGLYTPRVTSFVLRNLVVRLLLPLLIFEKVVGGLTVNDASGMALCFSGALAMIFGASGVAQITRRLIPVRPSSELNAPAVIPAGGGSPAGPLERARRSFALVNSFHNYGFIVYPLVLELYGAPGLSLAFVFALTCDALFWSYGVALIDNSARIRWAEILNPPFVTMLVSVSLAFLGLKGRLPANVLESLGQIGVITIPLALSTVGGAFYYSLQSVRGRSFDVRSISVSLALRALVLPVLFVTPVLLFLGPSLARNVLVVEAVMPASIGVVILSALYDGDHAFIVTVSGLSNVLAVVTIPLYLSWFM